jgi:superoxide reductase
MDMKTRFYYCELCGNIVDLIKGDGSRLVCCGQSMTNMVANTVDAAVEKHKPVVECVDGKTIVKVGSAPHPMIEEHYIEWVYVEGCDKAQRICLKPGQEPETFVCEDLCTCGKEECKADVYAYCNLHGLWKA